MKAERQRKMTGDGGRPSGEAGEGQRRERKEFMPKNTIVFSIVAQKYHSIFIYDNLSLY